MKIKKIISLIIVLAISITGFAVINNNGYYASANVSTSVLWDLDGNATLTGEGEYTKLSFEASKYAEYEYALAFQEFETVLKFGATSNFNKFSLKFTSDAPENSDDDKVVNTLTFQYNGSNLIVKLNDNSEIVLSSLITDELTIKLTNDKFKINTTEIGSIKEVGKYFADLKIVNEGDTAVSLLIASINSQKMKLDSSYNVIIDKDNGYSDEAPIIIFNTKINESDYYIPLGLVYTLDYKGYDVLSSSVTTELQYKKATEEDTEYKTATNNKFAIIDVIDEVHGDMYYLKFTAVDTNNNKTEKIKHVIVKRDNSAPEISSEFDLAAYDTKVKNAVYKDGTTDYINMGSGEYYYIPSFEDLFTDDVSSYSDMKYNMTYNTPSSANKTLTNVSASSLKIDLSAEGVYTFKICAIDQKGNIGEYSQLFEFEIYNTAGPQLTAPTSNDNGYVDTAFTSNSFTIKGISTSTVYALKYYDGTNWVDAEEELSSLTFTPTKTGQYKIICNVTDRYLHSLTAETTITVDKKRTIIKGETDWIKNNVWSIVFLCTGTLSLLGIIILLIIKPKEEILEVVDKDAIKKEKSKKEKKTKSK
jgi:hypothetical protein